MKGPPKSRRIVSSAAPPGTVSAVLAVEGWRWSPSLRDWMRAAEEGRRWWRRQAGTKDCNGEGRRQRRRGWVYEVQKKKKEQR